jgi:hypothetical protein
MTPFFRRDPDLNGSVRDRIVRQRPVDQGPRTSSGSTESTSARGGLAPIGGGSVAPISGGSLAPIGPSASDTADTTGRIRARTDIPRTDVGSVGTRNETAPADRDGGRIDRGGIATPAPATRQPSGDNNDRGDRSPSWRDRVSRPAGDTPRSTEGAPSRDVTPRNDNSTDSRNDWRSRIGRESTGRSGGEATSAPDDRAAEPKSFVPRDRDVSRSGDVPRRVIEGIVGGRGSSRDSSGSRDSAGSRDSSGSRDSAPRSVDRPQRDSSPPPPPRSEAPRSNGNSGGGEHRSGGSSGGSSSRSEGGKIQRNH